jgi:hypothetical protein
VKLEMFLDKDHHSRDGVGLGIFRAKDHHIVCSAHSEITLCWFYVYAEQLIDIALYQHVTIIEFSKKVFH